MSDSKHQVRQGDPPTLAGGVNAVTSATRHAVDQMGVRRAALTLLRVNQDGGFDCPGCAWPDPKHRTRFEFCENGAKAVADEATRRRVSPWFFSQWSVEDLAEQSDYWLNRQGRITHPMVLREGASRYEPISWDDAFAMIGRHLNALDSPDEAIFYTSGRTSNEAAFLYQLFVRQFGTNNLPDCSNMCHESSGRGLGEVIGIGKGTVTLEDFDEADLIIVMGQNPGTNHPRMLTALQQAKRHGAQIVSINPLREASLLRFKHPQEVADTLVGKGTEISDQYLQVRINGDVALLKGVMKALLAREDAAPGTVFDHRFIEEHTSGFEAFLADLRMHDWDMLVEHSGIERAEIEALADRIVANPKLIVCWAMGLTQHANGVANIQEVVNLLLLRGALGKPGAGACPVRGHSNVQGDRTVGIWERPSAKLLDALARAFDFEPPREHGYDVVAAIRAMRDGDAKVFFAMGGNFLSATPDTEVTDAALRRCALTVHVSTKLNRAHLTPGREALILPCLGRTERDLQASGAQFVTVENSMGIVHTSQGKLPPASPHLLSEPMIVARLAEATLGDRTTVHWRAMVEDYDRIRDAIERTLPGFARYNERVRRTNGFALPNPVRDSRTFNTANGKANFTVHPVPEHALKPGELLMMTVRSHDQYNTTIYGLDDRYRGIHNNRRVVLVHPRDIEEGGMVAGQLVDLRSHFRGEERVAEGFVLIPYDMPRRSAATYFPEANVLVPLEHVAEKSGTPASKSIVITIHSR